MRDGAGAVLVWWNVQLPLSVPNRLIRTFFKIICKKRCNHGKSVRLGSLAKLFSKDCTNLHELNEMMLNISKATMVIVNKIKIMQCTRLTPHMQKTCDQCISKIFGKANKKPSFRQLRS